MTKWEVREKLTAYINEILNDDEIIDEYGFRDLGSSEVLESIKDYLKRGDN